MEFNISGKITFDDFARCNSHYLKYNLFNGWKKLLSPLLLVIIVFTIIVIGNYYLILFVPAFVILFFILFRRNLKKMYYSNKFFLEEQHYLLTENQIEIKTESSSVIVTKDKINNILYAKDAIYILISSYYAYVIPKTFLRDDNFDTLKDFIQEHYEKQPNRA